jgi:thymidylate kinase
MLIALEGQDSTGKSTLCNVLANLISAVPYSTPPKSYLSRRTCVDENATADEHYQFYKDGTIDASNEIRQMIRRGNVVVTDRYWLTTYTYHEIMGAKVSVNDFDGIVIPTLTVILSLNHDVQMERLATRGLTAGDKRMFDEQKKLTAAFYKNALDFRIPFLVIDTLKFSPNDCARIIASAISL